MDRQSARRPAPRGRVFARRRSARRCVPPDRPSMRCGGG